MDTINLKNYHINSFMKTLNYAMPFARGRVKNRILIILSEKAEALEKSRIEILNGLADKDKEGKPVLVNNQFKISDKNRVKFEEEYQKMMNEDCIIDVTPSLKADIGSVKDMINTSTVNLDPNETKNMEEVLTALEVTKPKKLPAVKSK